MSCYHPKKAFILGVNPDTNKKILKITSYEVKYLKKYIDGSDYRAIIKMPCTVDCADKLCTPDCLRKHLSPEKDPMSEYVTDFLTIPCGQCLGCRIARSREWATRMMLEVPYSSSSWFVTLTYDDEHVPVSHCVDTYTGEINDHLTLRKRDLQLFNKRLRKRYGNGIRFYACGEYGGRTFRPHYHAIYFNLPLDDLQLLRRSADGKFNYYTSPTLAKLWPNGFHMVCEVSFETCAYVARYVTKKATGKLKDYMYDAVNIETEFSLMSRRPGLGRQWFEEHGADAYKDYCIRLSNCFGAIKLTPPSYYDRLFDAIDPERMSEIKELKRKKAENITRLKLSRTDLGYLDMLEVEENNFKCNPRNKYGLLSRKDI